MKVGGVEVPDRALTPQERRLLFHTRGKGKVGHAAPPGSGPTGETCGTCKHKAYNRPGVRAFIKCGLMESAWTHGPGTDIRAKDAACSSWEKKI